MVTCTTVVLTKILDSTGRPLGVAAAAPHEYVDMRSRQAYNIDMKLAPEVKKFLAAIGRTGGRARARSHSKNDLAAMARGAALSRWMQEKFGVDTFEELGLPGAEIVDIGLSELSKGNTDGIEALAVAEGEPRLRYLGVPVARTAAAIVNPREKLYRAMESHHGGMAHERFAAYLDRMDSFCDALSSISPCRSKAARRDRIWCR